MRVGDRCALLHELRIGQGRDLIVSVPPGLQGAIEDVATREGDLELAERGVASAIAVYDQARAAVSEQLYEFQATHAIPGLDVELTLKKAEDESTNELRRHILKVAGPNHECVVSKGLLRLNFIRSRVRDAEAKLAQVRAAQPIYRVRLDNGMVIEAAADHWS